VLSHCAKRWSSEHTYLDQSVLVDLRVVDKHGTHCHAIHVVCDEQLILAGTDMCACEYLRRSQEVECPCATTPFSSTPATHALHYPRLQTQCLHGSQLCMHACFSHLEFAKHSHKAQCIVRFYALHCAPRVSFASLWAGQHWQLCVAESGALDLVAVTARRHA
jgi:hypothetical protein